MLLGEGQSVFVKAVAPGRLAILQWMALYPGIHRKNKLNLVGYKKK